MGAPAALVAQGNFARLSEASRDALLSSDLLLNEGLQQTERTIQMWTSRVDEIVGSARQQLKLQLAACRTIGGGKSLLDRG